MQQDLRHARKLYGECLGMLLEEYGKGRIQLDGHTLETVKHDAGDRGPVMVVIVDGMVLGEVAA
jgi:hypothetical protein